MYTPFSNATPPYLTQVGADDHSDLASDRSAARTIERSSNDTAISLADMDDIINNKGGFESGDWGSVPTSPLYAPPLAPKARFTFDKFKLPAAQAHASGSEDAK